MPIGKLPHGVEPFSGWLARDMVMIWGQHPASIYRYDVAPLKKARVARLTKTQVILEDGSKWGRLTGVTLNACGGDYSTAPDRYIVPLTSADREELARVRMSLDVMRRLENVDITALNLADLQVLDRIIHQAKLAGKIKKP